MKIAKPLLLIITPIGVIGGLREAYRFGGGLVILMVALLTLISVAMISVVLTVRRERRAEEEAKRIAQRDITP
jgi:putative exporter of polyketide antibiotics